MPRQCQFPVSSTDSRRCYYTGTAPGFTLVLALVAALSGYAGLGHAAPTNVPGNKPAANAGKASVKTPLYVGWAKGRLLIAPRAGLSDTEFDKVLKSQSAHSKGRFAQGNVYVVELPAGANEVAVMQAMKKDHRLKYVELDMAMASASTVNDPGFPSSWDLSKINTPAAWDAGNGSGVIIAILDSGIDGSNPDLAANLVPGWNFYDNNSNTAETNGHGTWVAGVAAMVGNNSLDGAGVAYGAKIMPLRIASPDGYAYASTMAQAIYWAADHGARVANISYSGVPGNSTVQSAAQYMRSKGGVVVAAAGNSGALENIAADDSILAISATDQNDAFASFSSYGPYVDLAAPGVGVYSTTVGGGNGTFWGTSFSSPIVAGTVALMLSVNSKLAAADVDKILKSTAVDLGAAGFDPYYGAGRVDAAKAVAMAKTYVATDTQAPTISITSPTGGKVASIVPVNVNYSDNVGVVRAELYVNGNKIATDTVAPFAFAFDTSTYADGAYTLVAKAYDAAGNVGASTVVAVNIGNDTIAPVISGFNLTNGMTVSPSKQTVSAAATDNQSVAKVSLVIDGSEVAVVYGSSVSYGWNTRRVTIGSHSITVRAWDAAGNIVSQTVTVNR
jgi:thermitase